MDINDLRGVSTALVMVAFIALTLWAYSSKRKQSFDEAAQLPFADDEPAAHRDHDERRETSDGADAGTPPEHDAATKRDARGVQG